MREILFPAHSISAVCLNPLQIATFFDKEDNIQQQRWYKSYCMSLERATPITAAREFHGNPLLWILTFSSANRDPHGWRGMPLEVVTWARLCQRGLYSCLFWPFYKHKDMRIAFILSKGWFVLPGMREHLKLWDSSQGLLQWSSNGWFLSRDWQEWKSL